MLSSRTGSSYLKTNRAKSANGNLTGGQFDLRKKPYELKRR